MSIQYIELRLLSGATSTVLPNYGDLTFDKKYNDKGAIGFTYPIEEAASLGIKDQSIIAVYVGFSNGTVKEVERYCINSTDNELVKDDQRFKTVSGLSTLGMLADAVVYPSNWPGLVPPGHSFTDSNPGTIMRTFMQRAQDRGTCIYMTVNSFSGTADSNGAAWPLTLTQDYDNGATYDSVLQDLMDREFVDAKMVGWDLRLYVGGTLGSHISQGTIEIRPAQNATEMTIATDSTEACSTILFEGDGGIAVERSSGDAQAALGRRMERYAQQGGIADNGILTMLGDAELSIYAKINVEETVGIADLDNLEPFSDFDVADWVWARYEGDAPAVERRIRQIAVSTDENGTPTIGLTLNSIIYENDVRTQRRLDAYAGTGSTYGPPVAPTPDSMAPGTPTGLVYSSDAYKDGKDTKSSVALDWADVTTNADGTPCTDLDFYQVQQKRHIDSDSSFTQVALVDDSYCALSGYVPKSIWDFRVRGLDSTGNKGAWSATVSVTMSTDTSPPVTPSTLTTSSRLGVITLTWDGKGSSGAAMSADFDHLVVYRGTTANFTITSSTPIVGTLVSAGSVYDAAQAYNTLYYYCSVSVDRDGNISVPSPIVSSAAVPLVNTDIIQNTISGANIQSGTIAAYDKIIGNTITGALIQGLSISSDKIQSNAITADKITSGSITSILISSNAITADKISASAIDGKTIYSASLYSAYISGGTITGTLFQTGTSGDYITLGETSFNNFVRFYSGSSYKGSIGSQTGIGVNLGTEYNVPLTLDSGGTLTVNASSTLTLQSTNGSINIAASNNVYSSTIYNTYTSSGTAPVGIGTGGGAVLYRTTSRRDTKLSIEPMTADDLRPLLDVPVSTWFDRGDSERYAAYLTSKHNGEEVEEVGMSAPLRRNPGMVAEEVEAVSGGHRFVLYDNEGRVEGLMYDRLGVAWVPLLKELTERVEALEAKSA